MTNYQRKTLPSTDIGSPAPLPDAIAGLADVSLADLSAALGQAAAELGFAGQGFFPVADPPPAPVVPQEVLRMQGLEALRVAGLLDATNATVAAAAADIQLWFANTPVFHRTNDKLLTVAAAMGLAPDQVDALFIAANRVVV